ncbi:hypothetical protein Bca101_026646 [Brassica carinata]
MFVPKPNFRCALTPSLQRALSRVQTLRLALQQPCTAEVDETDLSFEIIESSRQDDRVFYFPQGHIEQEAFCDYQIRPDYSNFEVYAILEGSFVFPELPLMRIEGPVGKSISLKNNGGLAVESTVDSANPLIFFLVTGRWKKAEVAEANSKEHYKFAMSKDRFSRFGVCLSDGVAYVCRKKPQQTYLPTIPVVKLIPSGEFPECEIQQHKDEVAAHWTRLIGGEASCLCVGGEASEGGSEEKLVV